MIFVLIKKKSIFLLFILIITQKTMTLLGMNLSEELLLKNLVQIPSPAKISHQNSNQNRRIKKRKRKKEKLKNFLEQLYTKQNKFTTSSDDEPFFSFTEEDIHPDAFDQTKKITDYQAYVKHLGSLLEKKDILLYCNQLNRMANQIAKLEPQEQLEKYFNLLLNNLDADKELMSYFSIAITKIYLSSFKKHDKKKLLKSRINDLFLTFILPLVTKETQKQLEQDLQDFLKLEYQPHEIYNYDTHETHYTLSGTLQSAAQQKHHLTLEDAIHLELPIDTTCYSLLNKKALITVTQDGNVFLVDLNEQRMKQISNKINQNRSNIPYSIITEGSGTKKSEHIKILKAKQNSTPTFFLYAFHTYFFGKERGKIIAQHQETETIKKLLGHKNRISGLVPLQDSSHNYLASSSFDTTIKIWDFVNEVCLQTLTSSIGEIEGLAKVSTQFLIGLSKKRFLEIWNIQNKKNCEKIKLIEIVYSPVLSLTGIKDYCLTGLENGTLLIWNPQNGHCIKEIEFEKQLPIKKLSSDENSSVIATQETNTKKILTLFITKN